MRRRSGFTLVELLVALALIIFIMAIISQAFVAASKSFRDLKAAGDLARRMRSVVAPLRRDLSLDHFEGRRRLSAPDFWVKGPPREGFFRIYQEGAPVFEGNDGDGLPHYHNTACALHFTVRAQGNSRQDFFASTLPQTGNTLNAIFPPSEARYEDPGVFRSQWAEVTWFVRPTLDSAGIQLTANGTPLYGLYRRQYGVVPHNEQVNAQELMTGNVSYAEISAKADPGNARQTYYYNTPISLTMPARRMGMETRPPANANDPAIAGVFATPPPGVPVGYPALGDDPDPTLPFQPSAVAINAENAIQTSDLVLADVISFDVQVLFRGQPDFMHLSSMPAAWRTGNPAFPATAHVFDTWSQARDTVYDYTGWTPVGGQPVTAATIPLWFTGSDTGPIIRALRISIRAWDVKTETTRQVTVIQAM